MKEALFYISEKDKRVRCRLCSHCCLISPNQTGFCGVRENRDGVLYSLVYGKVIAGQVDPIEKKPLFHFLPGSSTFGVSTVGCNFRCQQCLNWSLSQADGHTTLKLPENKSEEIIKMAKEAGCQSISFTYNEPTISLEYNYEVMRLAHQAGLKNIWVSNGYMTPEALEFVTPYLDATNIDLKAFTPKYYQQICQAKLQPVLDNLKLIKKLGQTWLEITTLVIPTLNDSPAELEKIAKFIFNELGAEIPWHLSKFSPKISWQLEKLPATPLSTLEKAYDIGHQVGLKYIYLGNVWTENHENTYCPRCEQLVIKRQGYQIERYDQNGKCTKCGEKIAIVI
jgi:pyruvate formate lyase activating enzyme